MSETASFICYCSQTYVAISQGFKSSKFLVDVGVICSFEVWKYLRLPEDICNYLRLSLHSRSLSFRYYSHCITQSKSKVFRFSMSTSYHSYYNCLRISAGFIFPVRLPSIYPKKQPMITDKPTAITASDKDMETGSCTTWLAA